MKTSIACLAACAALWTLPSASMAQTTDQEMILTRPSAKTPEQVVEDIKSYTEGKKWLYLGADKVKNGEVTMVKVCIPEVGKILWPAGLQVSAMLPCGNFGVYQKKAQTEVSMLHPRYMQVLYPNPAVEKAVAMATPLLTEMLDAVAK